MKNQGRYRHLRVDWVGESSSESITLCGVEGEDIGTGQTLCPDCAQVADALHVCGLGPESLRELFDTLRVIGPSEVKSEDGGASRSGGADGYTGSVATQLTEWALSSSLIKGTADLCYAAMRELHREIKKDQKDQRWAFWWFVLWAGRAWITPRTQT